MKTILVVVAVAALAGCQTFEKRHVGLTEAECAHRFDVLRPDTTKSDWTRGCMKASRETVPLTGTRRAIADGLRRGFSQGLMQGFGVRAAEALGQECIRSPGFTVYADDGTTEYYGTKYYCGNED